MHFLSFLMLPTSLFVPASTFATTIHTHAEILRSFDDAPVLHFTLARRGGAFPTDTVANLTFLKEELEKAEGRFNLTRREVRGNKLVRRAREKAVGVKDEGGLMGSVGLGGRWYAKIEIGTPPQEIEMDLDMLVSDFYIVTTSSRKGSRYDDFFSHSNVKSNAHPYPNCGLPTDEFHLPTINVSVPLAFAHCRPAKSSLNTLLASGSTLGLAPSEHLSQTKTPFMFKQLLEKEVIERPIWSLMLINGQEGVLSVGGTSAQAVELVEKQTTKELDNMGASERGEVTAQEGIPIVKRGLRSVEKGVVKSREPDWESGWRWSKVQGAEGWWQILMQGVWADGSKVLTNQPAVIDINTPFMLAPPHAAKAFYSSISGSRPLPAPHSNFYIFPCLNPPVLHFEFGGWTFPVMQGGKGADWVGMPGGKFSLGRLRDGSGYCVGAVVETWMGLGDDRETTLAGKRRKGAGGKGNEELAGNGMRDVWVVGEGFFRGVGGVFDFKEQRIGFRTY